jgi:hypothetical protein
VTVPIELVLILVGLVFVLLLRPRRVGWIAATARQFNQLANRRALAVITTGLFALAGSVTASCISWPQPRIHDEFSYLLAADTFAIGRLTNPPHPDWVFFESFHVNQQPTYGSIYPPAQGLFLALGQVTTGFPITGVWLSFACACAALCWMLQGYLPPRWALFGALLATIRVGFLGSSAQMPGYWSQSYWGGAVAMLGGALVFGALPRLLRQARAVPAFILAVGLAILANSRPFEGLIVSVPVLLAIGITMFDRDGLRWPTILSCTAVPIGLVLGATGIGMAYYNYRVTGDPLLLPYQLNASKYSPVPLFRWQPLQPEPAWNHQVMADYQIRWAKEKFLSLREPGETISDLGQRIHAFADFYFGLVLLAPLVALPWVLRNRWMKVAGLICALLLVILTTTTWFQPHYAAPITGLVFALVVQGLRHVRLGRWRGSRPGQHLVQALPFVYACLFVAALALKTQINANSWHLQRADILKQLGQDGDRHLILVRYAPDHSSHEEWVYNRADIEAAKVVWARDMGEEKNRQLYQDFRGRRLWLLEPDGPTPRLQQVLPPE